MDSAIDMAFMYIWVKISDLYENDGFVDNFGFDALSNRSKIRDIYETGMKEYIKLGEDEIEMRADIFVKDIVFNIQAYIITSLIYDNESVMKKVRDRVLIHRDSMMSLLGEKA